MIRALAPGHDRQPRPGVRLRGAALDLWNELDRRARRRSRSRSRGGRRTSSPRDASNLALRAFALFAPVEDRRFSFRNRIPLERGLGSSAAAIAVGLVAGCGGGGQDASPDELLAAGFRLEGHADNLAAAFTGGVCLSWTATERRMPRASPTRCRLAAVARRPRRAREHGRVARRAAGDRHATRTRRSLPARRRCSARRSHPATPSCSRVALADLLHEPLPARRRRRSSRARRAAARPARAASRSPARGRRSSPGCSAGDAAGVAAELDELPTPTRLCCPTGVAERGAHVA